jgi:Transposase DDE domain
VEPLFGEGKQWHGMRRFRLRRLWRVNCEALVIATGQNLKRLLQKRGWGRRPFPAEAVMAVPSLASPTEKPLTNRSRTLRSRKVAVAGMISFRLNNRQSYAQILCFSLKFPFIFIFLVSYLYHILLVYFAFALSRWGWEFFSSSFLINSAAHFSTGWVVFISEQGSGD